MDSTDPQQQPPRLNVEPPRVEDDINIGAERPTIPGKEQLDEFVGKAVGGTVIASDIKPQDQPQIDPVKAQQEASPVATAPLSEKQAQPSEKANGNGATPVPPTVEGKAVAEAGTASVVDDLKNRTVGAFPEMTRFGWIEAFKRTDGPNNEFRDKSIWMEEFASSALFGSFWHNAGAMIVIPIVCYIVFKLGGGFVSLILIIAFGATYYKNSIRRFRRNARDDLTRELIKNALEDNSESVEWINNFMSKFWLIYEPVLSATVVGVVDGILVDQTPAFLDSIRLTTFTLGTKAPRVENIKTYPHTDPDVVMMDWRVSFTPTDIEDMTPRQLRSQVNPKIVLTIRVGKGIVGAGMPILVEDMSFKGYFRIKLKLTSNFPHIKTLDFSFLEPPTIDYVLKPVGGETFGMDIAHIPGLQSFIRDQTHAILGPMMYNPNVFTLDLEQIMTGGASLTAAIGVVQFTIYNAKDLKNTELVGNSDPYVKIRLGNRPELAQTAVKEDTLNPVFNETFTILVNNLNEVIVMELLDKDTMRKDRPLGQANFDLKALELDPLQDDVWCKVLRNGKERGAVRVRAAFFPIEKPKPAEDGSGTLIPVESNSGILAINVAQAKDIARSGRTKSICNVYLNGKLAHTTSKLSGTSPAWGANVEMFVTDLLNANIDFEIVSDGDVIGKYRSAAVNLIDDTKNKVDWVSLEGGEGTGKLRLNTDWKPILMSDELNPSLHKPPFGVVRIKLLAGRDLRNVEATGKSDPYVVITGDKNVKRGRTKVIDDNLNPVWNEIHYVAVNSIKQSFELEVFDYQKLTKDRTLGKTRFEVADLIDELPDKAGYAARPAIDKWAPLVQKDGGNKGELHYVISFHPSLKVAKEVTAAELARAPLEAAKAAAEQGQVPAGSASNLEQAQEALDKAASEPAPVAKTDVADAAVNIAATTLPPNTVTREDALDYDSGILVTHLMGAHLDKSNTYCEFYIDSDEYQYKSQTQKSRNPKWHEVADIFVKEVEYAKLIIMIKERSSLEKDPVIGVVSGNVRSILESTSPEGAELAIMDKLDTRGTLHVKFEYLPVPIELEPKERLDNMGNLSCTLIRGRNLVAADRGGSSDPYVVFKLNGKEVYKSECIKKTLDPEFNEQFTVPIASRAEDELTLEVFDWNQIAASKSLGVGRVPLQQLQLVIPNEFAIKLQNKYNQGEIHLRVKFLPEFLSSNKRRSGFGSTFIAGGTSIVAGGANLVGNVGMAGVNTVGAVGQGALDVGGAVGRGAIKGVGGAAKGVGAVGKGVIGGISAGASALGLRKDKEKNGSQTSLENTSSSALNETTPPSSAVPPPDTPDQSSLLTSPSQGSLLTASPLPRTSVGSIKSRSSMVFDSNEIVGEPGTLTVQIIEADGLQGVDKSGLSDPYVRVKMASKSIFKTKVKKENLHPVWNEDCVISGLTGHPVIINFCVKDHNTIGSDKDLGEFDLRLWEYIQPASDSHPGEYRADFWAPLSGSGGRLHLALFYEPSSGGQAPDSKRSLFRK
ncbi:hypothetical protein BGW42_004685 [Actinomortierella wolfii]|nr:hypothetical protein BGW42_004685 [Actinomortierella wolfii]